MAGLVAPRAAGRSWLWLQGMVAGAVAVLAPGLALAAVVLLVPGIVAMMMDATPSRPMARAMLLMGSAAAITPFRTLWIGGLSLNAALELLGKPETVLLAWGSGGIGWLALETSGLAARLLLEARASRAEGRLREEHERLAEEWASADEPVKKT